MCLFREVLGRQRLHVLRPRWLSEGFRSYPSCGRDCLRRLLAESNTFSVVVCFFLGFVQNGGLCTFDAPVAMPACGMSLGTTQI